MSIQLLLKYKLSDSTKGTISSSGLFTANLNPGECIVTASYGNIKDSAKIIIKGVNKLELTPEEAVTDKNRIITFTAKIFDTDSVEQINSSAKYKLVLHRYTWWVKLILSGSSREVSPALQKLLLPILENPILQQLKLKLVLDI